MHIKSLSFKYLLALTCGLSSNMVLADSLTGSYIVTGNFGPNGSGGLGYSESSTSSVHGAFDYDLAKFYGDSGGVMQASARSGVVYPGPDDPFFHPILSSSFATVTSTTFVTNSTDHGQYYTLNFHLAVPELRVSPDFSPTGSNTDISGSGSVKASVSASITTILNTVPCVSHKCVWAPTTWATHAELDGYMDNAGNQTYALMTPGVFNVLRIDDYDANRHPGELPGSWTSVLFDDYYGSLNLGYLEAGESRQVDYNLTANGWIFPGPASTFGETVHTRASIEDPFAIGGNGPFQVVATVPEPETYSLLVTGLVLLGGLVRRRGRKIPTRSCDGDSRLAMSRIRTKVGGRRP